MSRPHIPTTLRQTISEQARHRCGYCQTALAYSGVQLHIEHIIPLAAGGQSIESNLWLACALCNRHKGVQTHSVDTLTGENVSLFNPRTQVWWEYFVWSSDGLHIIGQTACGRATVTALKLNNDYIGPARKNWVSVSWHPPRE